MIPLPARALRVSYAGELGWELYLPTGQMAAVYDALMAKGEDFGVADFGMYAFNSLRMEKAYRGFGWELSNELTLIEADMERFAAYDKGDFVGRMAMLSRKQQGIRWKLAYRTIGPGPSSCSRSCPSWWCKSAGHGLSSMLARAVAQAAAMRCGRACGSSLIWASFSRLM